MKRISRITVLLIFSVLAYFPAAYSQQKKADTIVIRSSVVCGQCKDRVEGMLAFEKGVKSSQVDLDLKTITVVYNPSKTTPEKLRQAITKVGYDADDQPADQAAYDKLPACCKKDAPKH